MLAYSIETNTFAVGVGDGVAVGEPLGVGVGVWTTPGTVDVLCEQPPMPTIEAAIVAQAIRVMARSGRPESDIEGFPFTSPCARRPRRARVPLPS